MRVEISHSPYGSVNFVIHAETTADVVILRQFTEQWQAERRLWLHSYGGNIGEGVYSMCIGWRPESDFRPKPWWKRLMRKSR